MKRDFTFIDDIVDGIIAAMKWRDIKGGAQVFNLGNHQPVELKTFIRELEIALGKNATIHHQAKLQRHLQISAFHREFLVLNQKLNSA